MCDRRAAARWGSAIFIMVGTVLWAWSSLSVRGGNPEIPLPLFSLLLILAGFWFWKQQRDLTLLDRELCLAEARRELQVCHERLRQVSEQATLAGQAAHHDREQLVHALRTVEQRLDLQLDCTSELVFVLDLDGRLQQLSQNWQDVLGVEMPSLIGQFHSWLLHPVDLPVCQGAIERALATRSRQDAVEYRLRHAAGDWRWYAARITPLLDARGRMTGLLGMARSLNQGPQSSKSSYRKVHFDALTGLPDSDCCLDRLQQALRLAERKNHRVALLLVELDGLNRINQHRGHATGDLVLLECASRIVATVRSSDTVGRRSGATFTVLLPDIEGEREALAVAHKILHALHEPLPSRSGTLTLSASIGVAVYPLHGAEDEDLTAAAEQALCHARGHATNVALPPALSTSSVQAEAQPA